MWFSNCETLKLTTLEDLEKSPENCNRWNGDCIQCTARILSSAFLWRSTHGFGYVSSFFGDVLFIFSIFHSRKALYRINYFWEFSEEIKIKMRNFSWNERVDNREAWDGTAEEERGDNLACTRSFTITLYFCTLVEKQCLINYWNWIQLNILT